jgi:hypothetical protein
VVGAAPTSIFSSTANVEVGRAATTGGLFYLLAGAASRAQIYDGIGGTLVFDADFSAELPGTASFTESSANAATVTIN